MAINKRKQYFMEVVESVAKLSTCGSRKVGAILIKDRHVAATGYNGVPSGQIHCEELFPYMEDRTEHHEWSHKNELHAEQNLVAFCSKHGISMKDCTVLVSLSPCIHCAKLLINTGVKQVIFLEQYDLCTDGIDLLRDSNVECCSIEEVEF